MSHIDDVVIPDGHCPTHIWPLTIKRNHCAPSSEAWKCYCEQCVDLDSRDQFTYPVGYGRDPRGAIEDYAEKVDREYDQIVFTGEKHV